MYNTHAYNFNPMSHIALSFILFTLANARRLYLSRGYIALALALNGKHSVGVQPNIIHLIFRKQLPYHCAQSRCLA